MFLVKKLKILVVTSLFVSHALATPYYQNLGNLAKSTGQKASAATVNGNVYYGNGSFSPYNNQGQFGFNGSGFSQYNNNGQFGFNGSGFNQYNNNGQFGFNGSGFSPYNNNGQFGFNGSGFSPYNNNNGLGAISGLMGGLGFLNGGGSGWLSKITSTLWGISSVLQSVQNVMFTIQNIKSIFSGQGGMSGGFAFNNGMGGQGFFGGGARGFVGSASNPVIKGNFSAVTAAQLIPHLGPNLQPYAQDFVNAGNQFGVDPRFLASISKVESTNGTSNVFFQKNNAMGISNDSGATMQPSVTASIYTAAKAISGYGANTIAGVGSIYSPPGASNDINGTNWSWGNQVTQNYMSMSRS